MSRRAQRSAYATIGRRQQRAATAPTALASVSTGLMQRKCACGGGRSALKGSCQECQSNDRQAVPGIVHNVLGSSGQPMDGPTRGAMESRFGHDFSQVRVHTDARAAESAAVVNALAYTVGRNVVFGSGQYAPSSAMGRQLIAHELTHVLQQEKSAPASPGSLALDAPHEQTEVEAEQAASGFDMSGSRVSSSGQAVLQRQPAPPKAAPKAPAKTPPAAPPKTYPVENCPFPSDFTDPNEAGLHMMCVNSKAFEKAPSCNLTDKHHELLNTARESARRRVEKANSRMAWLGYPEYAQRVGTKIFKGESPDAKTIKETLAKMVGILGGKSLRFNGATCADPLCESKDQHAVAYESGATEPVTLCPRSFLPFYLPKLPRTIIHEAVHLSGIDIDPDVEELYCDGKGCEEQCQAATSAEAWTLFIDCIAGPLIKFKSDSSPDTSADSKAADTAGKKADG